MEKSDVLHKHNTRGSHRSHQWLTVQATKARAATIPTSRARNAIERQVFFSQQCLGMALRRSCRVKGGGAASSVG